jgi:hypothetical protein
LYQIQRANRDIVANAKGSSNPNDVKWGWSINDSPRSPSFSNVKNISIPGGVFNVAYDKDFRVESQETSSYGFVKTSSSSLSILFNEPIINTTTKTYTSITVDWVENAATDFFTIGVQYFLVLNGTQIAEEITTPSHTINALSPGTDYNVKVRKRIDSLSISVDSTPELTINTLAYVLPTPGFISEFNKTFGSFSVHYDIGLHGTPNEVPSYVRIYYSINQFSKANLEGIPNVDILTSSPIQIDSLDAGQSYWVRMIKQYSNPAYGLFESAEIMITLSTMNINITSVTMSANRTITVNINVPNSTSYSISSDSFIEGATVTTNPLQFQFPVDVSPGNKTVYIKIDDNGYTADAYSSYDLSINFDLINIIVELDANTSSMDTILRYPLSSLSTFTYNWESTALRTANSTPINGFEVEGSQSSTASTQTVTLVPILEITFYWCIVTEINQYGFISTSPASTGKIIHPPSGSITSSSSTQNSITIEYNVNAARHVSYGVSTDIVNSYSILQLHYIATTPPTNPNNPSDYETTIVLLSTDPSITISDLVHDTDYYFLYEIITLNLFGNQIYASTVTVKTSTITPIAPSRPLILSKNQNPDPTKLDLTIDIGHSGNVITNPLTEMKLYIVYSKIYRDVNDLVFTSFSFASFDEYEQMFATTTRTFQVISQTTLPTTIVQINGLTSNELYYLIVCKAFFKENYVISGVQYNSGMHSIKTGSYFASVTITVPSDFDTACSLYISISGGVAGITYTYSWSSTDSSDVAVFGFVVGSTTSSTTNTQTVVLKPYPSYTLTSYDEIINCSYLCTVTQSYAGSSETTDLVQDISWTDHLPFYTHPLGAVEYVNILSPSLNNLNVLKGHSYEYIWWRSPPVGIYECKWLYNTNGDNPESYNISYHIEIDNGSGFVEDNSASIIVENSGTRITASLNLAVSTTIGEAINYKIKLVKSMTIKSGEGSSNLLDAYVLDSLWIPEITISTYESYPSVSDADNIVDNSLANDKISFTWYKNSNTPQSSIKLFYFDMYSIFDLRFTYNSPSDTYVRIIELVGNEGILQTDGGYKKTIDSLRSGWDYIFWIEKSSSFFIRRTNGTQSTWYTGYPPREHLGVFDLTFLNVVMPMIGASGTLGGELQHNRYTKYVHDLLTGVLDFSQLADRADNLYGNNVEGFFLFLNRQYSWIRYNNIYNNSLTTHTFNSPFEWLKNLRTTDRAAHAALTDYDVTGSPPLYNYGTLPDTENVFNINQYPQVIDTNDVATNMDVLGSELKIPKTSPFTENEQEVHLWRHVFIYGFYHTLP